MASLPYATTAQRAAQAVQAANSRRSTLNRHVTQLERIRARTPFQQAELVAAENARRLAAAPARKLASSAAVSLQKYRALRTSGRRLTTMQQRSLVLAAIAVGEQEAAARSADANRVTTENAYAAKTRARKAARLKARQARAAAEAAARKAAAARSSYTRASASPVKSRPAASKSSRKAAKVAYTPYVKLAPAKSRTAPNIQAENEGITGSPWPSADVANMPWCCAAAVADALLLLTGRRLTNRDVRRIHFRSRETTIPGALGAAVRLGYIRDWRPVEPLDDTLAGTIAGVSTVHGEHAVLIRGDGYMVSWGVVVPVTEISEQYIMGIKE